MNEEKTVQETDEMKIARLKQKAGDLENILKGLDGYYENLDKVKIEVTAVLGHTRKTLKDLAGIGEGNILCVDNVAGETVDILANGQLVAKGEVVAVDEYFGVKITEIIK